MNRNILISTPAKRYAHALLDASIKQRNFTIVLEELEVFQAQLGEVPILRNLFLNPAVPARRKQKILEEIAKKTRFQQLTLNLLKTMIHRSRLNLLEQVIASAEQQFLDRQGIVVIEVTTARKLEPDEQSGLVKKLETFTGKKVQIENKIDRSILGGAVTRIGTTLYDGSVLAQLEQLRARMIQS